MMLLFFRQIRKLPVDYGEVRRLVDEKNTALQLRQTQDVRTNTLTSYVAFLYLTISIAIAR